MDIAVLSLSDARLLSHEGCWKGTMGSEGGHAEGLEGRSGTWLAVATGSGDAG